MDAIIHILEIWLICGTARHTKTFQSMGSHKCTVHYGPFPICNGTKPHVSVVVNFTVTTNHLIAEMLFTFSFYIVVFLIQDSAQLVHTIFESQNIKSVLSMAV